MTIKNILVYMNNDPRCQARLDGAIEVAKAQEARVTGVFALSYPVMPGYIEAHVGAELIERQMAGIRAEADRARTEFEARMERAGVMSEWHLIDGDPIGAMELSLRYGDIAFVGQANSDDPRGEDRMADSLVLSAGRPVVVWPYIGDYSGFGSRIMIAWNASRESVRAVHDAMVFLCRAEQVYVCAVNPTDPSHIPGADIATHLARHGVKTEARHIAAPELDAGNALLSQASDLAIDFLVMGGYGHSRLRELALGGVTRDILASMTMPVLMSH